MTAADQLLAFLEEENMALRAGRLDMLEENMSRKQALSAAFEQARAPVTRTTVVALRAAAERNERLLRAAREGLRRAVARTQERRHAASQLDTYDSSGRRQSHAARTYRLERRR